MNDEERREAWALFRYNVIAPLLEPGLDSAEKAETRKQVLAQVHTTPDGKRWVISERTLRTWLARHRKDQLKGLQNRRHETLGVMKSLDEQVLMQAKGLRERMRTRSIQDILVHLKMKGHDVSRISATTLNRHLNRVGATKEKNHTERGAYQHFAKEHINQLWQTDCTDGIWLPDPLGLKMQRRTYRDVDFKTALIRLKGNRYQASQNLAGERRVQVRWPFDDESAVNIWRRGKFIERAELFVAPADIDYSKRPVRKTEEEPKVLDCSKHLRLAMVARHRGEKMPADTSKYGFLTESEFAFVVEHCLNRTLSEAERVLLKESYRRLSPLDAEFVQSCLSKAVAGKGSQKHLNYYLTQMQEAKTRR